MCRDPVCMMFRRSIGWSICWLGAWICRLRVIIGFQLRQYILAAGGGTLEE
jgi:hypothetical protein